MPSEEVLGPRKTMFVLVIVVGCFAVLWPRILSPLILGYSRDQLKPNAFDREAGCCEVMFETELAVLELINEVCSSAVHADGKLSPYAAVECRKAVNETCGLDIAAFLKRTENIGKNSKKLVETMKNSNSSCLKEHFGVPVWSLGPHQAFNSWTLQDTVKQERPSTRGAGPHPALRERGRAIPPGAAPARPVTTMPPHVRPPPIPGMRPPLGSPGGPVPTPKSSMGFVMPIYTICIIVFFVYTLSKVLFKRTASPYEPVSPDHQFRSRVFRDDSRTSPDKLVVTAISGLVAEVQQQMDASYAQNQQRQEAQDDHARPYTNGTILHNTGPVHIVTSEYKEASKEKSPEAQKEVPEPSPEVKEASPEPEKVTKESLETKEELPTNTQSDETPEIHQIEESDSKINAEKEKVPEENDLKLTAKEDDESFSDDAKEESGSEPELIEINYKEDELMKLTNDVDEIDDVKVVQDFLNEESKASKDKQSTLDLLEEAIKEDSPDKAEEQENASVKMVVSGKMTLSLIQDAPRETPEKDPESTVDDFTTASAITQPAEKQAEEESEEEIEIEEEIEVEEIEEEIEDEEIEEIEEDEEDEPVETKEPLQVNEPVKVDENVKVTESVPVKEPVKEVLAKDIVEEAARDSEEIAEYEQEDREVKVSEPVKLKDSVKDAKI